MANRTTVKSNIVTQNVPTVSNADLTLMLNTELADNVVFREDVVVAQSSAISAITVDFTGKDRVELTRTGGGLTISITGIGDGEVKWLKVLKTPGQAISWAFVDDLTPFPANLNATQTVIYMVIRKGGTYPQVRAMNNTVSAATSAEMLVGTEASKLVTPYNLQQRDGNLITKVLTFSGWNMDTTTTISVAHGLGASWLKIAEINAIVYNNFLTAGYQLGGSGIGGELRGSCHVDSTNIVLLRTTSGGLDSAGFNAASGKIVVRYTI